jgi:hypothetical protein
LKNNKKKSLEGKETVHLGDFSGKIQPQILGILLLQARRTRTRMQEINAAECTCKWISRRWRQQTNPGLEHLLKMLKVVKVIAGPCR